MSSHLHFIVTKQMAKQYFGLHSTWTNTIVYIDTVVCRWQCWTFSVAYMHSVCNFLLMHLGIKILIFLKYFRFP